MRVSLSSHAYHVIDRLCGRKRYIMNISFEELYNFIVTVLLIIQNISGIIYTINKIITELKLIIHMISNMVQKIFKKKNKGRVSDDLY